MVLYILTNRVKTTDDKFKNLRNILFPRYIPRNTGEENRYYRDETALYIAPIDTNRL